jgi:hypothetical protein
MRKIAIGVLLLASAARAQEEPVNADVAAARALGVEGVRLAESGNCAEAVDKLQRAEKLHHAPTTLEKLGECQIQLGKLVDGTENLQRVVREALPPSAPAPFTQAQERARTVLAEAKPRIARLKVAVAAPAEAKLTVKIDDTELPLVNLNNVRPIDPGEHTVEATAPGYLRATAKVRLAEGGADSVALTLEPDPNAPKAPPPGAAPSTPGAVETPPPQGGSRVVAYVALGVGAVGLGVGAVTGILAMGAKSDLDSSCQNKVCPADQQSKIDSAKTEGTISTFGFIVGGAGLAVGAVLLLMPSSASAKVGGATVRPYVGANGGGLAGSF